MKCIFAAIALTIFSVRFAAADDTTIVFESKNGNVTFPHKKHQGMKEMKCTLCHEYETGGKISSLCMYSAYNTCKRCHEEKKMGPMKCGECHKK